VPRAGWLAAVAIAICVAGCARGSGEPGATTRTSPSPPPSASGPHGRLSPAEYRAIVREYRELKPVQQGYDDPAALDHGRRVCAALRQPPTQLVELVRADCQNAISFFIALRGVEHTGTDCAVGAQSERLACAHGRYVAMAQAIRITSAGAAAINDELQRRGITGLCAQSIGITQPQLDAYRRAEQAARDGADAIAVGDGRGLERAASELSDALASGGSNDSLRGIERGCRIKAKRKALPRVPDDNGINA
jgi:hypothetical protein